VPKVAVTLTSLPVARADPRQIAISEARLSDPAGIAEGVEVLVDQRRQCALIPSIDEVGMSGELPAGGKLGVTVRSE
jgi:hypothetical protein